ncbi:MAG: LysR substrate-binding domain-containing protein [Pseudomonadota bacterium]
MTDASPLAHLPWTALRSFEAASRLGSFQAAARELSVTPTAISHQIKRLEEHLGSRLFERLHRSLKLSPTGRILARDTQKAFGNLARTIDRLRVDGQAGAAQDLVISVVPSLAGKWLAPRLYRFQERHPRIGLRIVADETLVDLRGDKTVEIALRYGPARPEKGIHAERLWPVTEVIAVCGKGIARKLAARPPADLASHMLIRTAPPKPSASRSPPAADWSAWFKAAGVAVDAGLRRALTGPFFSTTHLSIEAAIAGRGIALAPRVLVEADIAAGRLVQPFAISLADPNGFWLLCREDRLTESRLKAFVTWIRREAAAASIRSR